MTITILGLGYGDPRALTVQAHDELQRAREIFVRTRAHPTVAALPPHLRVHSFDDLYESLESLDAVYTAIADALMEHATRGDVLYAVPGHPLFGETSTQRLLARARAQNIPTRLVAGTSFIEAVCSALELDPLARGLQIADATELARLYFPRLDPDQPALIAQVYSRAVASACKLTLLVLYPPEHTITRVDAAGTPEQRLVTCPLAEIDHADDAGLLTTWYVPPLARPSGFNALGQVVAHLRAPEGCPWDRAQTHQSLRKDFLEECYEVLDLSLIHI
jgi:tetrapyrrole methylase family protein/MazG family protein